MSGSTALLLPSVAPDIVRSVHGDKSQSQRERALAAFKAGACRALVATRSRHPRAVAPETIVRLAAEAGLPAEAVADPRAAVDRASRRAGRRGAVLVCGSLYLLADLRPQLVREQAKNVDRLALVTRGRSR